MTAQVVPTDVDPIARHVTALRRRLDGPRCAKADILREVHHGLLDAAEGYEADGVPAAEAARRAVAEFGDPAQIAGQFQTELAARQARSALAFVAVLGPIMEVSTRILWSNSPAPVHRPPDVALVVARVEDYTAWTVSVVAALALVGFGLGARWFAVRPRLVRLVAVGLVAKLTFMVTSGIMLSILFDTGAPHGATAVFAAVLTPLTVLVPVCLLWLAWRCWRVARRADELIAS